MRLVPRNQVPKLSFFQTRLAKWLENAEQMGSSEEEVAALADKVEAARVKLIAQQLAQSTARSATLVFNMAMDEVATAGANIIQQVRCKAATAGGGIYSLANISPPAKGSPIAPPGTPFGFEAELSGMGLLTLTWKCKNPRGSSGTMYQVSRRLDSTGGGAFEFLGNVGERRFVDETLPKGHSSVTYRIQALRSTATGDAQTFNVNFGGAPRMPRMINAAA